jgi:ATP/maltotriose-dependent transcriptional regulator MalT
VLSTKTVRNHITSIFAKLGVSDRQQAIARARELERSDPARAAWRPGGR